jgi:hypothetical protein
MFPGGIINTSQGYPSRELENRKSQAWEARESSHFTRESDRPTKQTAPSRVFSFDLLSENPTQGRTSASMGP